MNPSSVADAGGGRAVCVHQSQAALLEHSSELGFGINALLFGIKAALAAQCCWHCHTWGCALHWLSSGHFSILSKPSSSSKSLLTSDILFLKLCL